MSVGFRMLNFFLFFVLIVLNFSEPPQKGDFRPKDRIS